MYVGFRHCCAGVLERRPSGGALDPQVHPEAPCPGSVLGCEMFFKRSNEKQWMVGKTTKQLINDNDDDNDDDNDEGDADKNDGNDNDGLVGIAKLMDHWIHRAKKYQESGCSRSH